MEPESLFAGTQGHALCASELAALAPELAGLHGEHGLFVRADASAPHALSAPMLGRWWRLHARDRHGLRGDAICGADELPFADDTFRVVLIQHAADVLDARRVDAFRQEIGRVLAPEGLAVIVGLHPVSLWRPWLRRRRRGAEPALVHDSVSAWRRALARHGVDVYALRRLGPFWPRSAPVDALPSLPPWRRLSGLLRPSFVLLARKRRVGARPVRPAARRDEYALRPSLAAAALRHRA